MAIKVQNTEIKTGYKRTEVGVTPEDWEVKKLEDAVDFLDGKRRPINERDRAKMRGEYPYYGASGIVDYVNNYSFDEELILLGEDGENILSRNSKLVFRVSGKIWVNNHAHVLRPKIGTNANFLAEYLESLDYERYNTGTAQPKLNQKICSEIAVLLPTPSEQQAIAIALSDIDSLITSLDKLIAKKRDIKQATMQQLLTRKMRLPGFSGEWEVKRLGDVVEAILGGGTPSRSNQEYWGGKIPWVTVKDLAAFDPYSTQESITETGLRNSSSNLIKKGIIIISTRMAIGKAVIYGIDVSINQDLKAIFLKNDVSTLFTFYWFEQNAKNIENLGSGSTVKGISLLDLKNVSFFKPPTIAEQQAIATLLSDMDAEITALERKRDKVRDLKQGMMQELLTGKTRLL